MYILCAAPILVIAVSGHSTSTRFTEPGLLIIWWWQEGKTKTRSKQIARKLLLLPPVRLGITSELRVNRSEWRIRGTFLTQATASRPKSQLTR